MKKFLVIGLAVALVLGLGAGMVIAGSINTTMQGIAVNEITYSGAAGSQLSILTNIPDQGITDNFFSTGGTTFSGYQKFETGSLIINRNHHTTGPNSFIGFDQSAGGVNYGSYVTNYPTFGIGDLGLTENADSTAAWSWTSICGTVYDTGISGYYQTDGAPQTTSPGLLDPTKPMATQILGESWYSKIDLVANSPQFWGPTCISTTLSVGVWHYGNPDAYLWPAAKNGVTGQMVVNFQDNDGFCFDRGYGAPTWPSILDGVNISSSHTQLDGSPFSEIWNFNNDLYGMLEIDHY